MRTWCEGRVFTIVWFCLLLLAFGLMSEHMPALFDTEGVPPEQRSRSHSYWSRSRTVLFIRSRVSLLALPVVTLNEMLRNESPCARFVVLYVVFVSK